MLPQLVQRSIFIHWEFPLGLFSYGSSTESPLCPTPASELRKLYQCDWRSRRVKADFPLCPFLLPVSSCPKHFINCIWGWQGTRQHLTGRLLMSRFSRNASDPLTPPCHRHWSLAMTSSADALCGSSVGFARSLEASHSPFWNRVKRLCIHNSVSACKREIITGDDPRAASVIRRSVHWAWSCHLSPLPFICRREGQTGAQVTGTKEMSLSG